MIRPEPCGPVPAHSAHALRVSAAGPSPLLAVCPHNLRQEETCQRLVALPCCLDILDNVDTDLVLCTIRVVRQDYLCPALCPAHTGLGAHVSDCDGEWRMCG